MQGREVTLYHPDSPAHGSASLIDTPSPRSKSRAVSSADMNATNERQGLVTGPTRRRLLSHGRTHMISARGSEVIFRDEGGAEFSPATALFRHVPLAYSSSLSPCSTAMEHTTTPSTRRLLARADRRGRIMRSRRSSLILRDASASRRTLHPASVSAGGLPGFFGPYPSAIRDESRCRVVMRLLTKTLHEVVIACQGARATNTKFGRNPPLRSTEDSICIPS